MYQKKSLSNLVLLTLEKAVDGYVRLEDFSYNPHLYAFAGGWGYPLKKSNLSRTFKRLREKGLVDFLETDDLIVKLTDQGKEQALIAKMLVDDNEWDGIYRIIVFDIPEKQRIARDLLRMKLKAWGFQPWQKSVWASQKNCTVVLRNYIKQIGISEWVKVLESNDVGV